MSELYSKNLANNRNKGEKRRISIPRKQYVFVINTYLKHYYEENTLYDVQGYVFSQPIVVIDIGIRGN